MSGMKNEQERYKGILSKGVSVVTLAPVTRPSDGFVINPGARIEILEIDGDKLKGKYGDVIEIDKKNVMLWINDPGVLEEIKAAYPLLTTDIEARIKSGEFYFYSEAARDAIKGKWQIEINLPKLRHKERSGIGVGIVTYTLDICHPEQMAKDAADNKKPLESWNGYNLIEDFEHSGDDCIETFFSDDEALSHIDDMDFDD